MGIRKWGGARNAECGMGNAEYAELEADEDSEAGRKRSE
jgi:hypothetical protein